MVEKKGIGLYSVLFEKDYLKFKLKKFDICVVPSVLFKKVVF